MVGRLSVMPIFGGGKEDQAKTREKVCSLSCLSGTLFL
jgi:hypothetical protein